MHAEGSKITTLLRDRLAREHFFPTWIGVFINPFFLARHELVRAIANKAIVLDATRLLDIGCGSEPYRELFSSELYVGVDIINPGHDHTDETIDVIFDGRLLPFVDGSFDNAICFQVLEHVFHPDKFLGEINRVISPGGMLMLTVPFVWEEHEQPVDFARYTSFGLSDLLRRNGFEVESHERLVSGFAAIFQLFNTTIHAKVRSSVSLYWLGAWLALPFYFVFNISGLVSTWFGRSKNSLYLDNLVVARRR